MVYFFVGSMIYKAIYPAKPVFKKSVFCVHRTSNPAVKPDTYLLKETNFYTILRFLCLSFFCHPQVIPLELPEVKIIIETEESKIPPLFSPFILFHLCIRT